MLRIIAGLYRHQIIEAPDVNSTRPTTDKVREAVMSALGYAISEATILDLFAGSGALGLESLSRGAKKVYFCDNNIKAIKTIKSNINRLKIGNEAEVIFADYLKCLNKLKDEAIKFDIVFLDPPYIKKDLYNKVVDFLFDNDMLTNDAIIIKESNEKLEEDQRFLKHKDYRYGTINVLIERR